MIFFRLYVTKTIALVLLLQHKDTSVGFVLQHSSSSKLDSVCNCFSIVENMPDRAQLTVRIENATFVYVSLTVSYVSLTVSVNVRCICLCISYS